MCGTIFYKIKIAMTEQNPIRKFNLNLLIL